MQSFNMQEEMKIGINAQHKWTQHTKIRHMHELWVCATISSSQVSTKKITFGAYQHKVFKGLRTIKPIPKLPLQSTPTCGLSTKLANQQMGTLQSPPLAISWQNHHSHGSSQKKKETTGLQWYSTLQRDKRMQLEVFNPLVE